MASLVKLDRTQARELVEKISRDYGYIPKDKWERIPEADRPYFQDMWRIKDEQLGRQLITSVSLKDWLLRRLTYYAQASQKSIFEQGTLHL